MAVRRDEDASFALFYLIPQPRPDVIDAPVKATRLGRLVTFTPQVQAHGATARTLQALRDGLWTSTGEYGDNVASMAWGARKFHTGDGGPDRLRRLQEPPLERRLGLDVVFWEQARRNDSCIAQDQGQEEVVAVHDDVAPTRQVRGVQPMCKSNSAWRAQRSQLLHALVAA